MDRADLIAYWRAGGIDPDRCFYTGWPLGGIFEVDHLTPVDRGGTETSPNLVPCLPAIKQMKSFRTAAEFIAYLDSPELEFAAV
jgi:hypothetical protein